jgi:tRNA threonylcarbamoyladenosine biosynthesis protein TsaE
LKTTREDNLLEFLTISTNGVNGTNAVAKAIAGNLSVGDVVLLQGGLATGKTTFVKGFVSALKSSDVVTSPTFMLAQFYHTGRGQVLHIDAYRLDSIHEFRDLGLEPDMENSITLIEWGDKVAEDFPCALTVEFLHNVSAPDLRVLNISANCDRMANVVDALSASAEIA